MAVTVDQESLPAESLGLTTVGQVLSHVQRENRLVITLLIDGEQPDLRHIGQIRSSPIAGRTIYLETAAPREIALEVLDEVDAQLDEAERLKSEVVDLLQQNQPAAAMQRLSGCFTAWNAARESIQKTTQLLRVDVDEIHLPGGLSLADAINLFVEHLRQLKEALEARDFVTLADVLAYEMTETTQHWRNAIEAVRSSIEA